MHNDIDLSKLAGRVYVGRPNGSKAREYYKIDALEKEEKYPINIKFPSNAKTLTSSFFLGMFGKSVREAGSKKVFFERFTFNAPKKILAEVNLGVEEALLSL
ncbi:hypothetical protein [Shewanella algae]|uniref:hypothetical protein n=1 Tax=Shewanella algae TaxID=38313 RepID=UPI0023584797|nr:hypothetical protein [Shewanella algae]MDC8854236.1 hypothetical protein [Shewanella algae]